METYRSAVHSTTNVVSLIAIVSFSWVNWATVTFLLLTSCVSQQSGDYGMKAPLHGRDNAPYPGPEVRAAPGGGGVTQNV